MLDSQVGTAQLPQPHKALGDSGCGQKLTPRPYPGYEAIRERVCSELGERLDRGEE